MPVMLIILITITPFILILNANPNKYLIEIDDTASKDYAKDLNQILSSEGRKAEDYTEDLKDILSSERRKAKGDLEMEDEEHEDKYKMDYDDDEYGDTFNNENCPENVKPEGERGQFCVCHGACQDFLTCTGTCTPKKTKEVFRGSKSVEEDICIRKAENKDAAYTLAGFKEGETCGCKLDCDQSLMCSGKCGEGKEGQTVRSTGTATCINGDEEMDEEATYRCGCNKDCKRGLFCNFLCVTP